jgi:hypothetical protein
MRIFLLSFDFLKSLLVSIDNVFDFKKPKAIKISHLNHSNFK